MPTNKHKLRGLDKYTSVGDLCDFILGNAPDTVDCKLVNERIVSGTTLIMVLKVDNEFMMKFERHDDRDVDVLDDNDFIEIIDSRDIIYRNTIHKIGESNPVYAGMKDGDLMLGIDGTLTFSKN